MFPHGYFTAFYFSPFYFPGSGMYSGIGAYLGISAYPIATLVFGRGMMRG